MLYDGENFFDVYEGLDIRRAEATLICTRFTKSKWIIISIDTNAC